MGSAGVDILMREAETSAFVFKMPGIFEYTQRNNSNKKSSNLSRDLFMINIIIMQHYILHFIPFIKVRRI